MGWLARTLRLLRIPESSLQSLSLRKVTSEMGEWTDEYGRRWMWCDARGCIEHICKQDIPPPRDPEGTDRWIHYLHELPNPYDPGVINTLQFCPAHAQILRALTPPNGQRMNAVQERVYHMLLDPQLPIQSGKR